MLRNAKLPSKSPTVVFKAMDEGGVLFCSRTEVYFGLNEVGAAIWSHLPDPDPSATPEAGVLVEALQDAYPDVDRETLVADIEEFLNELADSELVDDAPLSQTEFQAPGPGRSEAR